MKKLMRALVVTLVLVPGAASLLPAQSTGSQFRWYIGGQAGVLLFETNRQTRSGIPTVGGNMLITARRTALLVQVEEGIGSNEQTSYIDAGAAGGIRNVSFNDLRKYSFLVMVYPLKSAAQPFVGAGFGLLHVHNPFPAGPFATPDEQANAKNSAQDLGSTGFASFAGGVQLQVGRFNVFGMYQITTSPTDGKLIQGPTHTFSGGIRFSLGGAKEGITGGGY